MTPAELNLLAEADREFNDSDKPTQGETIDIVELIEQRRASGQL